MLKIIKRMFLRYYFIDVFKRKNIFETNKMLRYQNDYIPIGLYFFNNKYFVNVIFNI